MGLMHTIKMKGAVFEIRWKEFDSFNSSIARWSGF